MTGSEQQTVLVVDIVGSTRLYEALGDAAAKRLVTDCLDKLTEVAEKRGGRVIAKLGDELVICFDSTAEAATSASEMHVGAEREAEQTDAGTPALKLRIGLHSGALPADPLASAGNEVLAIARRASELAKAEQTLITGETFARLPRILRAMTRYVDREPFRGASATWLELHELIWAVEGLTAAEPGAHIALNTIVRVWLRYGSREWILDERRPLIAAGRAEDNDIVVDSDLASRYHFTLKYRDGKCTLADMSTNGTYVILTGGGQECVWREPVLLRGEGTLCLGDPAADNEAHAIAFRCE